MRRRELLRLITRDPATGEELIVTRLESPASGMVIGTHGYYVDITPTSDRAQDDLVTAKVAEITEHRAVIEQAKGMLMLVYGVDAVAASLLASIGAATAFNEPYRHYLARDVFPAPVARALLALPFDRVAVLDVSETALSRARARLGQRASRVDWIAADIAEIESLGLFDVWHDRAVFHFLTEATDRSRYIELARRTLPPAGHLIIATFADDGPKRCSDLDVRRYNAVTMGAELGEGFSLAREAREIHTTPWGSSQAFFYGVFRRRWAKALRHGPTRRLSCCAPV